jgi:hypothetical protein
MKKESPYAGAKIRKRSMEYLFTPSLIEALKAAPTHLSFRTQVHAQLGAPIPDDKVTYKDIKDWIEFEWDPPAPPPPSNVAFHCVYGDNEYGTCRYNVPRHGEGNYQLTSTDLVQLLEQAVHGGWSMGDFWNNVNEKMEALVDENPPGMELDFDNLSTEHLESRDHDDATYNYSNWAGIKAKVLELLRKHNPNALAKLENGPQTPVVERQEQGDVTDGNDDDDDNDHEEENEE